MRDTDLSQTLLDWYDAHAREMPWRVPPAQKLAGVRPDPYRVWLSEVMLQQTTVAAVKAYFLRFTARWPDVADLAAARDGDVMGEWAGLGYYARARNLLKCARAVVAEHGGQFPGDRATLLTLPGIGPYTASAIAAIAFDEAATVVDGNVERVMARMYDHHTPLPAAKPALTQLAETLTPKARPGDYAQAVMDLGATICTPRNPACGLCPWRGACVAQKAGTAQDLPKKTPKKPKPVRHGIVYVGRRRDGAYLLERRPEKGLLGGMLGWPSSDWGPLDQISPAAPAQANWADTGAEVRHTFTHFHLHLQVMVADLPQDTNARAGFFVSRDAFHPSDLPTLMRKAFDLTQRSDCLFPSHPSKIAP